MSIKPLNWSKMILMPVGLAAIETCWVYPWSLLMGIQMQSSPETGVLANISRASEGRPLLSSLNIFELVIFSIAATRVTLRQKWSLAQARLALVSLGLVAVLLALHADQYGYAALIGPAWLTALASELPNALTHPSVAVLASALGVFLWWRGIAHGRDRLDFDSIEGTFRLGTVALVAFLLFAAASAPVSYDRLQASIGVYVVGFFLLGLTSLSIARIEDIREQSRARDDKRLVVGRHWLIAVFGVVVILLILALGIAQILSFDVISLIADPILRILGDIAWLLLYAFAIPMGLLLEVLISLVKLVWHPGTPQQPPQPPDMTFLDQLRKGGAESRLPPEAVLVLKWIVMAMVVSAAIVIILRAVFRWRELERGDGVLEEYDSVWADSSLKAVILAWLHSLYRRLIRAPLATPGSTPVMSENTCEPGLATIRHIYQQLLWLGRSVGLPRARFTTPYEHLTRLQTALRPRDDLAAITEVYVKARYGPEQPSDAEAADVRARWERVLASARLLSTERTEQPQEAMGSGGDGKRSPFDNLPSS